VAWLDTGTNGSSWTPANLQAIEERRSQDCLPRRNRLAARMDFSQ
jgi:hypothetical protein